MSLYPWTKKEGHLTLSIESMLRNLSLITYYKRGPAYSLTISLIDLNGDIRSKAQGLRVAAKWVAGPVPIDLPKSIIEDSGTHQGSFYYEVR